MYLKMRLSPQGYNISVLAIDSYNKMFDMCCIFMLTCFLRICANGYLVPFSLIYLIAFIAVAVRLSCDVFLLEAHNVHSTLTILIQYL